MIDDLTAAGKAKQAAKVTAQRETLDGKRNALASSAPHFTNVINGQELLQCYRELAGLEKIANCSQMQTLETIQKLNAMPKICARIDEIELDNRGWFLSDAEAEAEALYHREAAMKMTAAKGKGGGGGGGGKKAPVDDGFTTVKKKKK